MMKLAALSSAIVLLTALQAAALPSGSDLTDLTKRASHLKMGMSKCDVHHLLGKPTWIIGVGEDEEIADLPVSEWVWNNGRCNPVAVMFREPKGTVSGWDEGRAICVDSAEDMVFAREDRFLVTDQTEIGCD